MSEATYCSSTRICSTLTWIVLIISALIWESPEQINRANPKASQPDDDRQQSEIRIRWLLRI